MKTDLINLEFYSPDSLGAPIFMIQTDRLRIMFPFKGGSRSICALFGDSTHQDLHKSGANKKMTFINKYLLENAHDGIQNIFVLREPRDRFKSAWRMTEMLLESGDLKQEKYDHLDNMLRIHGEPYIHQIDNNIGWKYILFDEIGEYVKDNVEGMHDEKRQKVRRWYKKFDQIFDFDYEKQWYDYHVKFKKRMDPEEFHRLVKESNYINVKKSYLRYRPVEIKHNMGECVPKVTVFLRKNIMHIIPPRCGTKSFVNHFTGSPLIKRSITDEGYPFVISLDTGELETLMKEATKKNIPIVLNIREPIERARSGVKMTALWGGMASNHIVPVLTRIPRNLVTHVIPFQSLPKFTEKFQERLAEKIPEEDKNYELLNKFKNGYIEEEKIYNELAKLPKITPKRYFKLMLDT